jgi:hypothetical protein
VKSAFSFFICSKIPSRSNWQSSSKIPDGIQQVEADEKAPPAEYKTIKEPSKEFLKGYQDGQKGIFIGAIKWIFESDYRIGHMLGSHDKKKNIKRYKNQLI